MLTIDNYIDLARTNSGLSSDRQLAKAMVLSPSAPSFWRQKKSWPSDEAMIRLASLAGQDETLALVHLNSWRSTGHAATMYLKLAEKISATGITALFILGLLSAPVFTKSAEAAKCPENQRNALYYGKYRARVLRIYALVSKRFNRQCLKLPKVAYGF